VCPGPLPARRRVVPPGYAPKGGRRILADVTHPAGPLLGALLLGSVLRSPATSSPGARQFNYLLEPAPGDRVDLLDARFRMGSATELPGRLVRFRRGPAASGAKAQ